MMDQLTKDFYEKYLEFEKFLEFRMFDLTKKVNGRNPMFSEYASTIKQVQKIIDKYDNENYIVYVGCNTRPKRGRLDIGVEYRRTFFLDVEMDGDKPPLTDEVYRQKLMNTALYIWNRLKSMGIEPNYLGESGRGFHVGVKLVPLSNEIYDYRFRAWYKNLISILMSGRPYPEIKFDDSMVNPSRIQSCPGFAHNKYPEKPRRKVLVLYYHQNDLLPFINTKKLEDVRPQRYYSKHKTKYNNKSFYKSPEWLLVANNPDLPEGEIHNKIWTMIKCLARENNLNLDKLQEETYKIGYNELIDTPPDHYQYNPWTLFNWAMKHAEYCLNKKIILPYPFKETRHIFDNIYPSSIAENFPIMDINNFAELLSYIRAFNKATAKKERDKLYVYQTLLWEKIENGLVDKNLYDYIIFLNLKKYISGEYYKLDSEQREFQ